MKNFFKYFWQKFKILKFFRNKKNFFFKVFNSISNNCRIRRLLSKNSNRHGDRSNVHSSRRTNDRFADADHSRKLCQLLQSLASSVQVSQKAKKTHIAGGGASHAKQSAIQRAVQEKLQLSSYNSRLDRHQVRTWRKQPVEFILKRLIDYFSFA